jgi:hypothetical protein
MVGIAQGAQFFLFFAVKISILLLYSASWLSGTSSAPEKQPPKFSHCDVSNNNSNESPVENEVSITNDARLVR